MIKKIKDKLSNNDLLIKEILEKIGCTKITKSRTKNHFKFGADENSTGTGSILDIDSLSYHSWSRDKHGDIITVTSEFKNCSTGEAIKWLAAELNLKFEYEIKATIHLPFGGFWKNLSKNKEEDETYQIYTDDRYLEYRNDYYPLLWIKDNIDIDTMDFFKIGYCSIENRITIPWHDCANNLVGITARLNKSNMTDDEKKFKYYSLIPFNKGKFLYGLSENYKSIQQNDSVIIVESEKSVMKAYAMGIKNVVAVGCHTISDMQARLIKSLYVNKVVIAFDSDISLEEEIAQAQKCYISNPFFSNEIYVLDSSMLSEKSCVFDLKSREQINDIFTNNLIYIN